jgi:hypothetical protein
MRSQHVRHLATATLLIGLLVCTPVLTASCSRMTARHGMHGTSRGNGPPPHAPAHGYRHKHQRDDVELVFDSKRGVYLVVGIPGCYFHDGVYYRRASQQWQMTFTISGVWKSIGDGAVPEGLRLAADEDDSSSAKPGKGKGSIGKK